METAFIIALSTLFLSWIIVQEFRLNLYCEDQYRAIKKTPKYALNTLALACNNASRSFQELGKAMSVLEKSIKNK